MQERAVVLFTKPSHPGRVKTRLIGEYTASQAARLHEAFMSDLLAGLAGGAFDLRIAWALEEGEEMPGSDYPGLRQVGVDLGERMYSALSEVGREADLVAAIGSDLPQLQAGDLEEAFAELEQGRGDIVLGPTLDGGYYLLATGRERLDPRLFSGVQWSTPSVLEETQERCRALGLEVRLLPALADLDTPPDVARLATGLSAGNVRAPATERLLRRWNRLS